MRWTLEEELKAPEGDVGKLLHIPKDRERGRERETEERPGGQQGGRGKEIGEGLLLFQMCFCVICQWQKNARKRALASAHFSLSLSLSRESERYYRTLGIILYFTHLLYTMILYFTHLLHLGVAGRT